MLTTEEYERKFDEGTMKKWGYNSSFTLLKTNDKVTSLEIVPEKHTNIARFLNDAKYDKYDKVGINKNRKNIKTM